MASWVVYDVTAAAATLPPSLLAAYDAWLDTAEAREARLGAIASGVVADFRVAVAADADATGVLDEDTIPAYCLRHVQAMSWYYLAMECGFDPTDLQAGWQDGEVYLRSLYVTLRQGGATGAASSAAGTPRYSGSPSSLSRRASGFAGPADVGLPVTTGVMSDAELALRARLDAFAANALALAALGEGCSVEDMRARLNDLLTKMGGV